MQFKIYIIVLLLLGISCKEVSYLKDRPAHHTQNGFRNTSAGDAASFFNILKWRFSKFFEKKKKNYKLKIYRPELETIQKETPTVTWIGHSTVLLQFDGVNILTDPQFSMTASPVSWAGPERLIPPAITKEKLPQIDIVVISHDHYDHLDFASIKFLHEKNGKRLQFFVPLGMKSWFLENNIKNVTELDWWNHTTYLGWKIEAVPAKHHSGRGIFDHRKRLWAGWVVKHPKFNFFYSGDTAYSKDFKMIGNQLGPFDLAVIPIGGYAPRRLFKNAHIDPREAVKIHKDVQSQKSLGVHWGTFLLTDEDIDEPPKKLVSSLEKENLALSSFIAAKYGKTISVSLLGESN